MTKNKSKPLHRKRKSMSASLSPDLKEEYGFRSISVRNGDKVRIMRGDFEGLEGEITEIDTKKERIIVEGLETAKADETEVPAPVHPSNVEITKLEKGDEMREKVMQRKAETEISFEEEFEEVEEEETEVKEVEEDEELVDLLDQPIKDIKKSIKDEKVDYEALLEIEKENKNRKTLIKWLERRIGE